MKKISNKIICGFAGIGKSYLAKEKATWVDLESTPFDKNWDLYTDVAIHMQKNGYTPMVSCHKELRNVLREKGADYIVVIPNIKDKQNYIQRYKYRGNDNRFIELFENNWDNFINDIILDEETNVVILQKANETLLDYYSKEKINHQTI